MYIKFIWVAFLSFALIQHADGKKSKKKLNNGASESSPQANVLSYSTFGFNDIGSYDGFVPTSPDYANFLTKSQESSTRLYAPAFPSADDTTGLGNYYDPQPEAGSLNANNDVIANNNPYQGVSINFFTSNDEVSSQGKDVREMNRFNINQDNLPIYGAKLNSKSKNKQLNSTDFNIFESVSSVINGESADNNNVNNPNIPSALSPIQNDKIITIPSPSNPSNSLTFSKFVDFSDVKNYYPTAVEAKHQESIQKPIVLENFSNSEDNVIHNSFQEISNSDKKIEQSYKNNLHPFNSDFKHNIETNSFAIDSLSNNYLKPHKYNFKTNRLKSDYKEKSKTRPINDVSHENKRVRSPSKGYEYATNYSSTKFKYDYDTPKISLNNSFDEISPASSNLDFINYQLPESEFSDVKNEHDFKSYEFDNKDLFSTNYRNNHKLSEDYLNKFKNVYTTLPTTTSHWGNVFKNTALSSYKYHPLQHYFNDEKEDNIIYIPKKSQKSKNGRYTNIKLNDLPYSNIYNQYKSNDNKEEYEWPKDFFNSKFKSEEDLLPLRNQDTSRPYQQIFKPTFNDFAEDIDYKKLAQKWKQNYLRAKYRDANREYESYASETRPVHVPIPKAYPIEIPHPVIVPVPQPYPVKVPIPKPVAVPVIRELRVPIEKPMPYPVVKTVFFPIEKPVPVPVEKQVHVPVIKPYPVHIPQIRPVFHHTKTKTHDESTDVDEDEYTHRPETKRPFYKRPNSYNVPRTPFKRPLRMTYQDRNRKRAPSRRPGRYDQKSRRPYQPEYRPQKFHDLDEYDSDSEFESYCKRSGRC